MDLREPGDDLLAGLLVAMQIDRRVLLVEAPERGEHLLLFTLVARLDGERHDRRGKLDRRHLQRLVAFGEPVPGAGLLELGDGADIAGAELLDVRGLVAVETDQLTDPLLDVRAGVQQMRVVADNALVDAEQVDAPGERVRAGLEHVGEQLLGVVGLEQLVAGLQATVLDRRRKILDDRVEQPVRGEIRGRDPARDGEQRAVVCALLQRGDDLLVRDLLSVEVALHQRVGVLSDLVHELLAKLLSLRQLRIRDRDLRAVVAAGGDAVVGVGAHVDQVDHAGDVVF